MTDAAAAHSRGGADSMGEDMGATKRGPAHPLHRTHALTHEQGDSTDDRGETGRFHVEGTPLLYAAA
jgi:hypothetical protein